MVTLPDPLLARRTVLTGTSGAALGIASFALPSSAAAASIAIGSTSVAAVGGVVYGWGVSYENGVFGTQSGSKSAPVEVTGANPFVWPEIVQVAASRYNSFALTKDGDVYSSGTNQDGKLGVAGLSVNSSTVRTTPQQASISGVVQIASGHSWVLALKDDGSVWAWGRNDPPSGLATLTGTPVDVTSALWPSSAPTGADRVVQLSSSLRHSIALTATGRVFTWGSQAFGSSGVLGQGTTADLTSLTAVEIGVASGGAFVGTAGTPDQIIQVSAGEGHSLALGRDGSVYSWGRNNGGAGALGTGLTTDEGAPVDISANGDLAGTVGTSARIVQVSAGANFSLAVGLDGAVYAWGSASNGKLGNGATTFVGELEPQRITGIAGSALPTLAETSKRIVQVSARLSNGFALGLDARVYGWGEATGVGDGTDTRRPLPVEITASGAFANLSPNPGASLAPRRIVALATGDHNDAPHMLAIDDRG
jgi:alpha-tubulin suppressor-like RCC1 family protein